jgi:hypothetical protein
MRWLARATPWKFSSARRVASFGRAGRWDWHVNRGAGHASTPSNATRFLWTKTSESCRQAASACKKKCETNPMTSFAINGLAFPARRRRIAGRPAATPSKEFCRGSACGSGTLRGDAAVDHQVVRGDVPPSRAPTAPRATPRTWSGARDAQCPMGSYRRGPGYGVCLPVPCLRWRDVAKTKRTQRMVKNQVVSVFGVGVGGSYAPPASSTRVAASTRAPAARSSGLAYSAGLWLMPLAQGTKIMPAGASSARKLASWKAPEGRRM